MNKLSQFWQELKRRNVVRVVTVYAGAAFVIIELINNITEPLSLPEWTPTLVIVLLAIGFPIVIIFSWIYDVHPEGGMVKTEPVNKVSTEKITNSSNIWKVASYISFVVIVGLIVLNVVLRKGKTEILDKSIAVLPFESLSDDPEKRYQADGVMDAILLHLSKIEDLRVIGRTSVEQYRGSGKTVNEICEELDVSYILEGSYRRYGDEARLIVQLIQAGSEGHVWANNYDRDWVDIFSVESEVAQAVAEELQAVITPEVKQRIEKFPTSSLNAYDFYQQGKNEVDPERAQERFMKALEYDSAFAMAYIGLAQVYRRTHFRETYLSETFLDSMLVLANKALSYDPQLSEAYRIRGNYFRDNNNRDQALVEYDKAIRYNPNDWETYAEKFRLYSNIDLIHALDNLNKAANLYRGPERPGLLRVIAQAYQSDGFYELRDKYARLAFELDGDSLRYYRSIAGFSIENWEKLNNMDPDNTYTYFRLGELLSFIGDHTESLRYFQKYIELGGFQSNGICRVGYAYLQNGFKDEAYQYLDMQIEYSHAELELGRRWAGTSYPHYDLADVYAARGEKEKALEHLRLFNVKEKIPFWLFYMIRVDPMLNSIRDEPEFQQILSNVEAKYQAEHERVRQWLEENDML